MKKSAEILGLPIISITEGRELGMSKTLLIDAKNGVVAAITIEDEDWYRGVKLIPYESVIAIGDDAVTITHSENILNLDEAGDYENLLIENIRVIGTKAITKTGRIQGKVTEVIIGEGGKIEKCEITAPDGSINEVLADQIAIFGKQVTVVDIDAEKKNDFVKETSAFKPINEEPSQETWTPVADEETLTTLYVPEENFETSQEEQESLEKIMTPDPIVEVADSTFTNVLDNQPVIEEESQTVEAQPVVEEESQTVEAQPVVEEESQTVEAQPSVEEESQTVEAQPVIEEESQIVEAQPSVEEESQIVEAQPSVEEESQTVEAQPVVEEESQTVEAQPVVEEESQTAEAQPSVEEESQTVEAQPVVEEESQIVEAQPVVEEESQTVEAQPPVEEKVVVEEQKIVAMTRQAEDLKAALQKAKANQQAAEPTPQLSQRKQVEKAVDERRRRVLLGKHATKTIMAESGTLVVEAGAEVTEEVLQRARLSNKFIELSMNVQ